MKIEPGTIVTLAYDITTADGDIVETSDISGPITFMHGKGAMIPGLDARLSGLEAAAEATFEFEPHEAFGRLEDAPRRTLSRAEFPAGVPLEVGSSFEAGMGGGQSVKLEVVAVGEGVEVRLVHPLAGKPISMSVRVVSVRAATSKEAEAGRALTRPPGPPPARV